MSGDLGRGSGNQIRLPSKPRVTTSSRQAGSEPEERGNRPGSEGFWWCGEVGWGGQGASERRASGKADLRQAPKGCNQTGRRRAALPDTETDEDSAADGTGSAGSHSTGNSMQRRQKVETYVSRTDAAVGETVKAVSRSTDSKIFTACETKTDTANAKPCPTATEMPIQGQGTVEDSETVETVSELDQRTTSSVQ